jgi:predicted metal-binding membrane protein
MAAGFYQFSPWKYACLSKCRAPLGFLLTEWREGLTGAFVMGVRHGLFCTGCCWLIMALLFVAGVMNLAWIAVLTVVVLAEKILPYGRWVSSLAGAAAVVSGGWLLIRG